ncbi:MAG TPA: protein kinase [Gemmatimonadales bacterium]|nr:protein kinase [Gemmatimonadales bacterium]
MDLLERFQAALADRYQIERELGRGGMATVYLARDLKHDRHVALKVLRPEVSNALGADRFLREIGIAGRLQHPHILSLHDSGEAGGTLYYAMPLVEGESLRARLAREVQLDVSEAVGIAKQVADALAYAHAAGVLHRDIKPENILLSAGHAIVADFGIARALDQAGSERLTETGLALGTPSYMSPEQASGSQMLDARSDLYALGCVLFEMLAGQPPFTGPTAQSVMARHAIEPVPSLQTVRPTIPTALDRVISKALAKVPADRFVSIDQFQRALASALQEPPDSAQPSSWRRRVVAGLAVVAVAGGIAAGVRAGLSAPGAGASVGESTIRSLAVESFENLTGDSGQVYLARGITDQVETELAQIGSLRVIGLDEARGAAAIEVARRLDMQAVLSGALQRAGGVVRITARLRSTETGQAIWARSFDGDLATILQLQADVARAVAERIRVSLTLRERSRIAGSRPQVTPAAYEAYVRGFYFQDKGTEASFQTAIGHYAKAIDADPTFAAAYAGLAECYASLGYFGALAPEIAFPHARAAASKALALDSTLARAHRASAYQLLFGEWNFAEADRAYARAVALDSTDAYSHWLRGMYLTAMNRSGEAIASVERAQQLDPLSLMVQAASARSYYNARRYQEAIDQAKVALDLDSTYARARFWIGMAQEQLGRSDEAIRELKATIQHGGPTSAYVAALGHVYATSGRRREALRLLHDLEIRSKTRYVSPLDMATVRLGLGDTDSAFALVSRAVLAHDGGLVFFAVDPRYESVRQDPRLQRVLRRIGFPDSLSSPRAARPTPEAPAK